MQELGELIVGDVPLEISSEVHFAEAAAEVKRDLAVEDGVLHEILELLWGKETQLISLILMITPLMNRRD